MGRHRRRQQVHAAAPTPTRRKRRSSSPLCSPGRWCDDDSLARCYDRYHRDRHAFDTARRALTDNANYSARFDDEMGCYTFRYVVLDEMACRTLLRRRWSRLRMASAACARVYETLEKLHRGKTLVEAEWRDVLGVQQSDGWHHYAVPPREVHVLPMRRLRSAR